MDLDQYFQTSNPPPRIFLNEKHNLRRTRKKNSKERRKNNRLILNENNLSVPLWQTLKDILWGEKKAWLHRPLATAFKGIFSLSFFSPSKKKEGRESSISK